MADQQHLDLLKQGTEIWNQWKEKHAYIQVDLSGANLSETDLRGANLHRADLRWANLKGARLNEANLKGARLNEADLSGADLSGSALNGADLSGAYLYQTILTNIDLQTTRGLEEHQPQWPLRNQHQHPLPLPGQYFRYISARSRCA